MTNTNKTNEPEFMTPWKGEGLEPWDRVAQRRAYRWGVTPAERMAQRDAEFRAQYND